MENEKKVEWWFLVNSIITHTTESFFVFSSFYFIVIVLSTMFCFFHCSLLVRSFYTLTMWLISIWKQNSGTKKVNCGKRAFCIKFFYNFLLNSNRCKVYLLQREESIVIEKPGNKMTCYTHNDSHLARQYNFICFFHSKKSQMKRARLDDVMSVWL